MSSEKSLKRIAAMHDISGFGKCALTIAIPVISACGVEVSPLPTAVLSTNTGINGFVIHDCTPYMEDYLNHWKEIDLNFDAFYSGFLGSSDQIRILSNALQVFKPELFIFDPVMGDNGLIYKTYTPKMCEAMKSLVAYADVITPNLTEACKLTGRKYDDKNTSPSDISSLCRELSNMGASSVVITGIERDNLLVNCILDKRGYNERPVNLLPYRMHGTGDLFASVLTGGLLTGHSLYESVDSAADFVLFTMEKSQDYAQSDRRGVCFEPYLHLLSGGIYNE